MSRPRVTILTDFGTVDGYVAAMKGVIAEIAPDAAIDDASHAVPHGDIEAAAWALACYWRLYPPGTVHLIVVDPGVGTTRRALAAQADDRFLVAPDNGVLTRVLAEARAVQAMRSIESRAHRRTAVSRTFHGRDIFAPAAAHLAVGEAIERLGPPVADPVRLELRGPVESDGVVVGRVVHVDRFGNLITDIGEDSLPEGGSSVTVAGTDIGLVRGTYGDVEPGGLVALIGSTGRLEVAVRDGSAALRLGAERGAVVRAQRSPG